MQTEIVIYDQMLADAAAGLTLCFCQPASQKLDTGQCVEQIANFDEQTIESGNCLA
jgi:hypothetical protein